ncbi:MAG: spore cortex biosynthesis protein YabQ [Oscillospiraceae bacterium]
MENTISGQLLLLSRALLLGGCIGLLYDLLRAFRLRFPGTTRLLDGVCALTATCGVFLFALGAGAGELRLYVLAGILLGCLLFFGCLSRILRPLWSFWVDALLFLCRLVLCPLQKMWALCKRIYGKVKKLFLFCGKWGTIRNYKWTIIRIHRRREAAQMAKTPKKRQKAGFLTKVLLLALLLGLGVQLYRMQDRIAAAQAERQQLSTQVAELHQENEALSRNIENGENQELMEKIAREELGLVNPGEKVFYDVSN